MIHWQCKDSYSFGSFLVSIKISKCITKIMVFTSRHNFCNFQRYRWCFENKCGFVILTSIIHTINQKFVIFLYLSRTLINWTNWLIVWGFYFIQYFTVHKLRCSVFNIFKICTFTYHSTFSLRCFIGIRRNNFFDISFSVWFDWRIQVNSKMFYGNNVNWFLFWKLKYFPCIALLSFTQIAATLANALRCELPSIKPVLLKNVRAVRIRALEWSFALDHKPITFESTSPTSHQVWPRPTIPRGFKVLSRIKWNIKNGSPINIIW